MSSCWYCNKVETEMTTALLKCSVCKVALYCNRECQSGDFKKHKPTCKKNGTLDLFAAIQANDEAQVRRLSKIKYILNGQIGYTPTDDPGPNVYEMEGWSALHECIRSDKCDMLYILANAQGVKLDIKDCDGETPLFVAATSKNPNKIRVLLDAGANPNSMATDGWSAMMMAVRGGRYEQTEALLQAGADMHAGGDMLHRGSVSIAERMASGQMGVRQDEGETYEEAKDKYRRILALLRSHM
mmetsp:Transcript_48349/g.55778  ORF Transcript_48349/g.55778 Transcript_48349/m.55778 type:complete len:242 (-) Transcript_48349:33-758(-)